MIPVMRWVCSNESWTVSSSSMFSKNCASFISMPKRALVVASSSERFPSRKLICLVVNEKEGHGNMEVVMCTREFRSYDKPLLPLLWRQEFCGSYRASLLAERLNQQSAPFSRIMEYYRWVCVGAAAAVSQQSYRTSCVRAPSHQGPLSSLCLLHTELNDCSQYWLEFSDRFGRLEFG